MKAYKIVPAILTLAGLAACGGSSSKSDATATTTGTTRTPTGTVQAASVDELGLTGALNISLPAALSDGTSLRLAGEKSTEACLMRESAKQLVTQIKMISSTLCHIEAEGKNIPWNTPVILDIGDMAAGLALQAPPPDGSGFPGGGDPTGGAGDPTGGAGDPTGGAGGAGGPTGGDTSFTIPKIGIYTDDSDANNIAVYICEGETTSDMKLSQAFKITGSKTITKDGASVKVSKGTVTISSGDDQMTFKGAIGFDSYYTEADANAMKLEVKLGVTGMFSFAQKFELSANDSGLSKVSISEVGTQTFGSESFSLKKAGVGMFDAINGNVLYSYDGGNGEKFSTQACVDAQSNLVACSDAKFAEGGALHLKSTDVPGVLPASFSPTAPSGFDCATADWSKTIKPATDSATTAKHQACDEDIMKDMEGSMSGMADCFQGYAQSSQPAEIEFSESTPGDFEPELPPLPAE